MLKEPKEVMGFVIRTLRSAAGINTLCDLCHAVLARNVCASIRCTAAQPRLAAAAVLKLPLPPGA